MVTHHKLYLCYVHDVKGDVHVHVYSIVFVTICFIMTCTYTLYMYTSQYITAKKQIVKITILLVSTVARNSMSFNLDCQLS